MNRSDADRDAADFELKSTAFRREREAAWKELDSLVTRIERRGLKKLDSHEAARLPVLYRSAVSSLSVARAISLDRNLREYLETLTARAYLCVYSNQRFVFAVLREFFKTRFPAAVHRVGGLVALSGGIVLLGVATAFALTMRDMDRYDSFVPAAMSGGRTPASTTESLRNVLYSSQASLDGLTLFASYLFTNNSKVGILCFAVGFAAGAPTVVLLFFNGLGLGAMLALYASRGMGLEFLAWVAGHGVTELLAVVLCGAAGLALGRAMLFPGRASRVDRLAETGRATAPILIGSVLMLLLAAFIEGYLRQLVPSMSFRWLLAAVTGAFWIWYFVAVGGANRETATPMMAPVERRPWN
ncbi:MAG: stage II sporulation protein M [Planctomyces sp.]|nr:stage II sporulation protein M [Planctomyces sp.]